MLEDSEAFFTDPKDGECKETIKNARRKLEVPVEAAIPCKKGTKNRSSFQETETKSYESNNIPKTNHTCIVEAHESTRQRLESSLPNDHEDHIAGKGYNSTNHLNQCAQIYSDAPSDEHFGCESSSGQGMEEARNICSMAIGQNEEQKRCF